MPGMPVTMGQPICLMVHALDVLHMRSAAADPILTYFSAIAGQDGEADAEKLQRYLMQSGISGTSYFLAARRGVLSAELLEEKGHQPVKVRV